MRESRIFARNLHDLLKDFDLHGLLAQHPLQVAYALFERPDFTGADDLAVRLHSGLASAAHVLPPAKQLAGREAGLRATNETFRPGISDFWTS